MELLLIIYDWRGYGCISQIIPVCNLLIKSSMPAVYVSKLLVVDLKYIEKIRYKVLPVCMPLH